MPSQFVHIECYSLTPPKKTRKNAAPKWSAGDILAEAARRPGACDHVTAPLPPTLIHGATLEQVEAELTTERPQKTQEVFGDVGLGPGLQRALGEGGCRVGDDQLGVDLHPGAEPGAGRARTEG